MASTAIRARLTALAQRFALPAGAAEQLAHLLALVADEPAAITSVRDHVRGVDIHIADSLVALEFSVVRSARRIADLGAGGGFPGLPLAIALPEARVALVESIGRKASFLERAAQELSLANVEVVNARAEDWPAGTGAHDLVTARALAPLPVLLEYAAPLLQAGGSVVAWKGRRDAVEEADAMAAAAILHMSHPEVAPVRPFPAASDRHLYLSSKVGSTPKEYPRRAGMARKRPLGVSSGR